MNYDEGIPYEDHPWHHLLRHYLSRRLVFTSKHFYLVFPFTRAQCSTQRSIRSRSCRKTRVVCRDDPFIYLFIYSNRGKDIATRNEMYTRRREKCKCEKKRCDVIFAEDNFFFFFFLAFKWISSYAKVKNNTRSCVDGHKEIKKLFASWLKFGSLCLNSK